MTGQRTILWLCFYGSSTAIYVVSRNAVRAFTSSGRFAQKNAIYKIEVVLCDVQSVRQLSGLFEGGKQAADWPVGHVLQLRVFIDLVAFRINVTGEITLLRWKFAQVAQLNNALDLLLNRLGKRLNEHFERISHVAIDNQRLNE